MIHATTRMTLPTRQVEEALEILRSVAERTRVQPGCISFGEISQSTGVETIEKAISTGKKGGRT
jgi:quinol monooxygenase YgiN